MLRWDLKSENWKVDHTDCTTNIAKEPITEYSINSKYPHSPRRTYCRYAFHHLDATSLGLKPGLQGGERLVSVVYSSFKKSLVQVTYIHIKTRLWYPYILHPHIAISTHSLRPSKLTILCSRYKSGDPWCQANWGKLRWPRKESNILPGDYHWELSNVHIVHVNVIEYWCLLSRCRSWKTKNASDNSTSRSLALKKTKIQNQVEMSL